MSVSRFLLRVVLPVTVVFAGAIAVAVFVLFAAVRGANDAAVVEETNLVAAAARQRVDEVTREQRSVAIWDDSVRNIQHAFDEAWTHVNFGAWMFDYFGHNLTYILDGDNAPIYAASEGARIEPRQFRRVADDVRPLVAEVRARSDARLAAPVVPGREPPAFAADADVTIVDGRPSVAAVMTIVPEDDALRNGARPYILVSVKYLDRAFLESLVRDYQLDGAEFESRPPAAPERAFVPLRGADGTPLAFLVWDPDRPGAHILSEVAGVFALAVAAVAALTVAVLVGLWLTARRLLASRAEASLLAGRSATLASHDALTGLANRGVLLATADGWLARSGPGRGVALHAIDLFDFKGVNDRFGHAAGDAYLREIALRLTGFAPDGACVARLGGDEFAILVADVPSPEDAELLAARLVAALRVPVEVRGNELPASGSVGTALSFDPAVDGSELFRRADVALFEAKQLPGGGRRAYDAAMSERVRRERQLREDLAAAIAADRIELAYQPIFDRQGTIVALEALARWRRGDGASVAPAEFVPIAEASGTIGLLTDRVLDRAARDAAAWPAVAVTVNVSPADAVQPGFAERVARVLEAAGLAPSRLVIEVTESALAAGGDLTAALETLRAGGITLAIDDFGAGFSNLSRLAALPVDIVKIDASLVAAAGLAERGAAHLGEGEPAGGSTTPLESAGLRALGLPDVPKVAAGPADALVSAASVGEGLAAGGRGVGAPPTAPAVAGALKAAQRRRPVDHSAAPAPAVLSAVVALGRAVGLTVIGEGIERPAEREAALAAGCDLLQGYLLSPPLAADEVARRLAAVSPPPGLPAGTAASSDEAPAPSAV
jgi:diguanylate cyclase (GGDEF)-like protein